jgi:hypothetical protein
MKNFLQNKKIIITAFILGLFLSTIVITQAVFVGPTQLPPDAQPVNFIFTNRSGQIKQSPTTTELDAMNPTNFTFGLKRSGATGIGLGTEGLLSWTTDDGALDFNASRAIVAYGKLVADLSSISGTGKYARTAVKLFTKNENQMSVVVSNKPILGFWLDKLPLGSGGGDTWATGFFNHAAVSSLVIGDNVYRTNSFSGGTTTDLDIGGPTNIGLGDVCLMTVNDTCPLGSYLSTFMPLDPTGTPFAGSVNGSQTLAEQYDYDPLYGSGSPSGISLEYSRACTYFDPSPSPQFIGVCPTSVGSPATTGLVKGIITPVGAITAGAEWKIDGAGTSYTSGQTVSGIAIGNHTISYTPVSGWSSPPNSNISVTPTGTAIGTGNYSTTTGSLTATITPAGAITNGAKWKINGLGNYSSGYVTPSLPAGSYTISYTSIPGYITPSSSTVVVNAGATASTTGTYTQAYDILEQKAYITSGPNDIKLKICLNPLTSPKSTNKTVTVNIPFVNNPPLTTFFSAPIIGTVTIPAGQLCGQQSFGTHLNYNGTLLFFSTLPPFGVSSGTYPSSYVRPSSFAGSISVGTSGLTVDPSFTGHP